MAQSLPEGRPYSFGIAGGQPWIINQKRKPCYYRTGCILTFATNKHISNIPWGNVTNKSEIIGYMFYVGSLACPITGNWQIHVNVIPISL